MLMTPFSYLGASPFTTPEGVSKFRLSLTSAKATELVMKDDDMRGNWGSNDFSIDHRAADLGISYGLNKVSEISFHLTYKSIKNNGLLSPGPQPDYDTFQGWSSFAANYKRLLFNSESIFLSGVLGYVGPGSDYNPNTLVTPGIESPEYLVGLSTAWVSYSTGLMLGLDLKQALRPGRAEDQTRFNLGTYYFGVKNLTVGVFYGGVRTNGGIDIGDSTWVALRPPNTDEGDYGLPFARLKEVYDYVGGTIGYSIDGYDVTLSYTEKLITTAKNTDINKGMTLALGGSI